MDTGAFPPVNSSPIHVYICVCVQVYVHVFLLGPIARWLVSASKNKLDFNSLWMRGVVAIAELGISVFLDEYILIVHFCLSCLYSLLVA